MDLPVMPPVKPMLAKAVPALPDGPLSLEPKWDGFRCLVFRDGDELHLGSRNTKPLDRYFPEVLAPLRASLPPRCVVDGELFVAVDGRLDFDALGQRIHPAESRVTMLSERTPAEYVVFDLLALDDLDLRPLPFRERRAALERVAGGFAPPVHLAPATTDRDLALRWFERFEGAGLDGLIAKPLDDPYVEDRRTQLKLKHVRTADCVVAGYRVHKDGEGVGSLVLGLFDDQGGLQHVGVAASFTARRRRELLEEVAELRMDSYEGHPWASWMRAEAHEDGSMPGAPSRWSGSGSGRDHSWVPLRPERVAEVRYSWATAGRFRGTTKMLRWRPDREPGSCSTAQLAEPDVVPVREVLRAGG